MLKGPYQNLLINRICPNPLMFLQGVSAVELGRGVCLWGCLPRGCLPGGLPRGLPMGVSAYGGVCLRGVSAQRVVCQGGLPMGGCTPPTPCGQNS